MQVAIIYVLVLAVFAWVPFVFVRSTSGARTVARARRQVMIERRLAERASHRR